MPGRLTRRPGVFALGLDRDPNDRPWAAAQAGKPGGLRISIPYSAATAVSCSAVGR
jgi:hypothetical protein